jgi:hypothetical protein
MAIRSRDSVISNQLDELRLESDAASVITGIDYAPGDVQYSNSVLNSRKRKEATPVITLLPRALSNDYAFLDTYVEPETSKYPDWCFLCYYSQTPAETQTNPAFLKLRNFLTNNYGKISPEALARMGQRIYNLTIRGFLLKPVTMKANKRQKNSNNTSSSSSSSSHSCSSASLCSHSSMVQMSDDEEDETNNGADRKYINRPWYLRSILEHLEHHHITSAVAQERALRDYNRMLRVSSRTAVVKVDPSTGVEYLDEKGTRLHLLITAAYISLAKQIEGVRDPRIV